MNKPKNKSKRQPRPADIGQRMPANAYYRSRRGDSDSPFEAAAAKKKTGRRLVKGLDILLAVLLISGLVYILLVSRQPKVIVNDSTYHSAKDYQTFLSSRMGGLGNGNKISFDQTGLVTALKSNYPEVKAASAELPVFSRQPVFRIEVATPALFLKGQKNSYLINTNGISVGPKDKYKNLSSLAEVVDQSGFDIEPGKQVLSSADIQFILAVSKEMKIYNIPIKMLAIPNLAQQLNVYTVDAPYYVKFFTGGDPSIQAAQMIASRQQFSSGGQPSQYLDVRVSGKVFYK
jgi:hypothetical protein